MNFFTILSGCAVSLSLGPSVALECYPGPHVRQVTARTGLSPRKPHGESHVMTSSRDVTRGPCMREPEGDSLLIGIMKQGHKHNGQKGRQASTNALGL